MWKANNPIAYLLQRRFERDFRAVEAELARRAEAAERPSVTVEFDYPLPNNTSPASEDERAYLARLEAMSADELREEVRRVDEAFAARIERAQPYNQPLSDDEALYWAKMQSWTVAEAVALSLDRDPRRVKSSEVLKQPGKNVFFAAYGERHELVFRRGFARQTGPRRYIDWFASMDIDSPNALRDAVDRYHPPKKVKEATGSPTADSAQRDTLGETERQTFLKILLGIALEQYRFDPKAKQNKAASQISSDLAAHGLSVSDDTVREKLKQAVEKLLPGDWKPPDA